MLVCDQATEVTWSHTETFQPVILRLGTFHTICTFLAVIGKRFGDAGLRDIAIESGVIAEGSLKSVFRGKTIQQSCTVSQTFIRGMHAYNLGRLFNVDQRIRNNRISALRRGTCLFN